MSALLPGARVAIVASRFNESVTTRLLAGARACCVEHGLAEADVEVHWVPGAWELPVMARALVRRGGLDAVVAVGAVIRGETAHFDVIAGETARGLMSLAVDSGMPVGFGVLTCDTMEQALARSGGALGNKGHEAVAAALATLAAIRRAHADPR
jgi:6,7-dimethyl-8-ribityllumazine synthase